MGLRANDPGSTRYSLLSRLEDVADDNSWREFFERYWKLIHSLAINAGLVESEAQDVVQETIISVARDIHKFKRDRKLGSFRGWLRNTARWRIADQFRRRLGSERPGKGPVLVNIPASDWGELPDPAGLVLDVVWEREWQKSLFETAAERVKQRVKEEQYQIFDLCVNKGWPAKSVAKTMGTTIGNVYVIKHRVALLIANEIRRLEKDIF